VKGDGNLDFTDQVQRWGIGRDASDLLRKIKAAQYVASHPGEVCPAKWKEGEAVTGVSRQRQRRYSVKGDGNLDFTDQVQRWSQRRFR
jgi:hypothetical protein